MGVDEPSNTFSDLSLQFRFFESDGTTPVSVIPVPEPSNILAYALALAIGGNVERAQTLKSRLSHLNTDSRSRVFSELQHGLKKRTLTDFGLTKPLESFRSLRTGIRRRTTRILCSNRN